MVQGQGQELVNWSSWILKDKDFPSGQQHRNPAILFSGMVLKRMRDVLLYSSRTHRSGTEMEKKNKRWTSLPRLSWKDGW